MDTERPDASHTPPSAFETVTPADMAPPPAAPGADPAWTPAPETPPRRGRAILITAAVLLLAGICVGGFFLLRRAAAGRAIEDAVSCIPKTAYGFVSLDDPSALMNYFKGLTEKVPDLKMGYEMAVQSSRRTFGADLLSPEGWAESGLDATRPLFLSVLPVPGCGDKADFLVGIGIRDEARATELLKKLVETAGLKLEKDTSGSPVYVATRPGGNPAPLMALAFGGSQALMLFQDRADAQPAARLRELMSLPRQDSLLADPEYQAAVKPCPSAGLFSLFVNIRSIVAATRNTAAPPLLSSLQTLAAANGMDSGKLYLTLDSKSPLLDFLKPGGSCPEMLKAFGKPMVAITVSLENLVGLYRFLVKEAGNLRGPVESASGLLLGQAGLALDELEAATKGGSLGVLVFAPKEGLVRSPEVIAVLSVAENSQERLAAALRAAAETNGLEERPAPGGTLFCSRDTTKAFAVGMVGKHLVGTNAPARLLGSLESPPPPWTPQVATGDICTIDYFPGELIRAMPERQLKAFSGYTTPQEMEKAAIHYTVRRLDNGVLVEAKADSANSLLGTMTGVGLAAAIPIILGGSHAGGQRPDPEVAAMAMLRNIASAEVAFQSKIDNNERYGRFQELAAQGFLDSRFQVENPEIDGFQFSLSTDGKTFKCAAAGLGEMAGKNFFINENMVVCKDIDCEIPANQ